MINQYETVFIATPVLSEAQMKETVDKFRSIIQANEGEVVHEEDWALKSLPTQSRKSPQVFITCLNSKPIRHSLENWKQNTVATSVSFAS